MPKQESVNLNVQPGANNGQGWVNVLATNGQPYAFKYTGGNNDNGGLETMVGDGTATISVSLNGNNNRYSIADVAFTGDTNNQLSRTYSAQSATITDINTVAETADYAVVVEDSNVHTTIICDPMIKNDPKNPPMMAMDELPPPRIVHQQRIS
jgi:hypothetical protein